MFPSYIPSEAHNLSEATSIDLAKQIEQIDISTPLSQSDIATTLCPPGQR